MPTQPSRIVFAARRACRRRGCAASPADAQTYQLPPKAVVDILDAAPTPTVIVAPDRQTVALLERSQHAEDRRHVRTDPPARRSAHQSEDQRPSAADRRRRRHHAEGYRRRRGQEDRAARRRERRQPRRSRRTASTCRSRTQKPTGIELWIADAATGQRALVTGSDRLNATAGEPCDWLDDSTAVVCEIVPPRADRRPPNRACRRDRTCTRTTARRRRRRRSKTC